jgi:parvulin-like peptidyl-prolyl isomerase
MKRLLLAVAFTAMLASAAAAEQVPDPRVADLVQAGKILQAPACLYQCLPDTARHGGQARQGSGARIRLRQEAEFRRSGMRAAAAASSSEVALP